MTNSWDTARRGVGTLSIWLGTAAFCVPRPLARVLGVLPDAAAQDVALPVLVRLVAARNIAMGAALLVTPAPQARRTTQVALLLTGLDAGAVLRATSRRELAPRSAAASAVVLAAAVAAGVRWRGLLSP